MAAGSLDALQVAQLAQDFASLSSVPRNILNDPNFNLTAGQVATLNSDMTTLGNIASSLADWSSKIAFDDAAKAFSNISSATKTGNAQAHALQADVSKLSKVITILGKAVALGIAFSTGGAFAVIAAAASLAQAAA